MGTELTELFEKFHGRFNASLYLKMLTWLLLNLVSLLFRKGVISTSEVQTLSKTVDDAIIDFAKSKM